MLILVVDDDSQIRKLLQTGLAGYGYQVLTAVNGAEALTAVSQRRPDLVILDISLGSALDGLEVCRRVREWSAVPIIILSVRTDAIVAALDAGADDYVTKPFSMEELRARMQAVWRRMMTAESGSPQPEIVVGALRIDLAQRTVHVGQEEVHFTPMEYDILRLLVIHPGRIITHHEILRVVWGAEYVEMTHYVRIYINQIRKKLGENPAANVRYILNEPGVGYRFVAVG